MSKPREFYVGSDLIVVDKCMMPILSKFTWHTKKDKNTKYVYTSIKIAKKNITISMHRLLTGFSSFDIDHINRNGLDNRLSNLRYATKAQNSYNRIRKNKYGFRGVYKPKKSPNYSYQIQSNGIKYHKHGFKTAKEAAIAYDAKNKELHGEFGIRNFKD